MPTTTRWGAAALASSPVVAQFAISVRATRPAAHETFRADELANETSGLTDAGSAAFGPGRAQLEQREIDIVKLKRTRGASIVGD
jgi:hypothetical protein